MEFTDLFLLVGTNPLPNFVTAKHFITTNEKLKRIFLIYSDQTKIASSTLKYSKTIKTLLSNDKIEFQLICLKNIENATEICNDMKKIIIKEDSTIHLNFTGGTKVMGIYAHNYVSGLENKKSYSYLSPRTFMLTDEAGNIISNDLRSEIGTTINDVIELHGFKIIPSRGSDNIFENADTLFYDIVQKGIIDKYYKQEGGYNRGIFHDEKRQRIIKKDQLKKHIKYNTNMSIFSDLNNRDIITETHKEEFFKQLNKNEYKIEGEFLNINKEIPEKFKLFCENGVLKDPLPGSDKIEKTIKYLDGLWFENYCFKIINELKDELKNTKFIKNIFITKDGWSEKSRFEIDGILMQGYQFFGISITTDGEKELCKLKGFEIINRITQIGGDEAKAILITLLSEDKALELKAELRQETGGKTNIFVIGKENIKAEILKKLIKNFMEGLL